MSYVILGIDPGIADTGFGLIKKDKQGNLVCLDYGSIKTKAQTAMPDRLEIINKELRTAYLKWCEDEGEKPIYPNGFASNLEEEMLLQPVFSPALQMLSSSV